MAGKTINDQAQLTCPHGGTVSLTASASAKSDSGAVMVVSDMPTVSGCSFQLPMTPPVPSPCVMVQFVVPNMRVRAGSTPTLAEASVGLCMAGTGLVQGPVQVSSTQSKNSTM